MSKNAQEQLVMKREPKVVGQVGDIVTIEIDISGEIASKEGKDTHVTVSGNIKCPRTDGKVFSLGINGWYK